MSSLLANIKFKTSRISQKKECRVSKLTAAVFSIPRTSTKPLRAYMCHSSLPRQKAMQGGGDISKTLQEVLTPEKVARALISVATITQHTLGPDNKAEG